MLRDVVRLSRSPLLGKVVSELAQLWKNEQRDRQAFYDNIADGVKTEFINGETIMHSPDRLIHVVVRRNLTNLLGNYVNVHQLGLVGDEKLLICLTRNDYMPDVVFFSPEKAEQLEPDQMQLPAPDFVAEVLSPSTRKRDRGVKFEDYAAHGVREYWIIDPKAETVELFRLNTLGKYAAAGMVRGDEEARSEVIKGFKVAAKAFFDDAANLAALKKLLR
jgi:Uma2 family endonuclease